MGQLCLTGALRWAPVSVVLPMDYSSLIWATLFGWLIWDHSPGESTWAGSALIVALGRYIAWRVRVRALKNERNAWLYFPENHCDFVIVNPDNSFDSTGICPRKRQHIERQRACERTRVTLVVKN